MPFLRFSPSLRPPVFCAFATRAQEWPSIYEQVSYEVGGDVFSLQELEHCVLRGRLPRPSLKDLPKRFAPLPPEGDDHYAYSLGKVKIHGPSFPVFVRFGPRGRGASGTLRCRVLLGQQVQRRGWAAFFISEFGGF